MAKLNRKAAGTAAFCRLFADIKALPEKLRPGFQPEEDDSVVFDYEGATKIVGECLQQYAHAPGFVKAMAVSLVKQVSGGFWEPTPQSVEQELDLPASAPVYSERMQLARWALYQTEELMPLVQRGVDSGEGSQDLLLGLVGRVRDLNDMAMQLLSDGDDAEIGMPALRKRINGSVAVRHG